MVQQVMLVVLYLDGKPITTLISLFLDIDDELNKLGIVNHSELLHHEIHTHISASYYGDNATVLKRVYHE